MNMMNMHNINKINNAHNILIIFDWDDTLFPTGWITNNGIRMDNLNDVRKYILYFKELDGTLSALFEEMLSIGKVIIVTNANATWIKMSKRFLYNTSNIIDKYIPIFSARDTYQNMYDVSEWKIHTFQKDIYPYMEKANQIISIGDANYEYDALVSLKKTTNMSKGKHLKNIKLVENPTFDILLDQLGVITRSIRDICNRDAHMDLKFNKSVY